MRRLSCLLLVSLTALAAACLNDRDTLAAEVANRPDVLWVIVGRFERNPPLYYHMRIDRVEKELRSDPSKIDLYDDIAVAYDRIHDDARALVWIEKKRALLEKLGAKGHEMDWYRYYANAGTFHTHHWFATRPKQATELHTAEHDIGKAIQINPNAHFGREGYQLAAISWTLGNLDPSNTPISFAESPELGEAIQNDNRSRGIDGLAGLIRLGGAWESPDIFDALAMVLGKRYYTFILADQATLRRNELVDSGHKAGPLSEGSIHGDSYATRDKQEFKKLRADAEAWNKQRNDFMLSKLQQGKHPDTDPDFWNGYQERPKPEIWSPPFWETIDWANRVVFPGIILLMAGIAVLIVLRAVKAAVKRNSGSA